jgi:hypothetical protein
VLTTADLLPFDVLEVDRWLVPAESRGIDPAGYAAMLEQAGFVDVDVRDVTDRTFTPYCAVLRDLQPETIDGRGVGAIERALAHYVVATARRGERIQSTSGASSGGASAERST